MHIHPAGMKLPKGKVEAARLLEIGGGMPPFVRQRLIGTGRRILGGSIRRWGDSPSYLLAYVLESGGVIPAFIELRHLTAGKIHRL